MASSKTCNASAQHKANQPHPHCLISIIFTIPVIHDVNYIFEYHNHSHLYSHLYVLAVPLDGALKALAKGCFGFEAE